MKKTKVVKLRLDREAIRVLQGARLKDAIGGKPPACPDPNDPFSEIVTNESLMSCNAGCSHHFC